MKALPARSLVVVSAGLGQPSTSRLLADRLSVAVDRYLRDVGVEADIEVIELREYAQDLTNNLLTGFPSPRLQASLDAVLGADGLIVVTPIFSASFSGLFKMFFDVIDRDGLAGKPSLIAATGGSTRHSLAIDYALRPLFAYLNAAVVATGVYAAAEDWGGAGVAGVAADSRLVERVDRAARELAAAMLAGPHRAPADPFEAPVPFEELLRWNSASGRGADD
ncbi:MAG: FMN reductase [Chloroflexota bacterium]